MKSKLVEKQVSKGTKRAVRERFLTHEHYVNVLRTLDCVWVQQNTIQSMKHKLGTFNQRRRALSGYDTKRYIRKCGIKTLAHGHYLTEVKI